MIINALMLVVAFVVILLATNYLVEVIEKLTSHSKLSKFTLSLFVVGIITSLPEISISLNSVLYHSPQIALGNLIGSQIFLLFFVIPILAIVGRGLWLQKQMKNLSLALTLLVTMTPILMLLNQTLESGEALIIFLVYFVFISIFFRQSNLLERIAERIVPVNKINMGREFLKLITLVAILFLAGNTAVWELIQIASFLQTPRFLLSLIILPIGTNLPELSLAFGILAKGRKDFALNDFLGALSFNSLLISVLVFSYGGEIMLDQNIDLVIFAFVISSIIFWFSCLTRELLNTKEGLVLLLAYFVILATAIWQIMSLIFT